MAQPPNPDPQQAYETGPVPGFSTGPVGPQPTGPMTDFPQPPPAIRPSPGMRDTAPQAAVRDRAPRDRAAPVGFALGVLAFVLLQVGLATAPNAGLSVWQYVPTWGAFATMATLAALVPAALVVAGKQVLPTRAAWRLGLGGGIGLAVFWVLVILPGVATNTGFIFTAALALVGGALWLSPGRE